METVIIVCLLVVIALLLQDKTAVPKKREEKQKQQKPKERLPDIMGQSKPLRGLSVPKITYEVLNKNLPEQTNNFDIETDEDHDTLIPQEDPDDVFRDAPDLEEEEQEWNRYGISGGDDGFAQGVTFEELSCVGMLLRKENLEPSQKETAIGIVQKIQGTELFSLLENSMESASRKIAELLDGRLSSENENGSSYVRKNDLNDFNIGDFI